MSSSQPYKVWNARRLNQAERRRTLSDNVPNVRYERLIMSALLFTDKTHVVVPLTYLARQGSRAVPQVMVSQFTRLVEDIELYGFCYATDVLEIIDELSPSTLLRVVLDVDAPAGVKETLYSATGALLRQTKQYMHDGDKKDWALLLEASHLDRMRDILDHPSSMSLSNDPIRFATTIEERDACLSIEWLNLAAGIRNNYMLLRAFPEDEWKDAESLIEYDWASFSAGTYHDFNERLREATCLTRRKSPIILYEARKKLEALPILSRTLLPSIARPGSEYINFKLTCREDGSRRSRWLKREDELCSECGRVACTYEVEPPSFPYGRLGHSMTDRSGIFILPPSQAGLGSLIGEGSFDTGDVLPSPSQCEVGGAMALWNMLALVHTVVLFPFATRKRSSREKSRSLLTWSDYELPMTHLELAAREVHDRLGVNALGSIAQTLRYYHPTDKRAIVFYEAAVRMIQKNRVVKDYYKDQKKEVARRSGKSY